MLTYANAYRTETEIFQPAKESEILDIIQSLWENTAGHGDLLKR